MELVFINSLTLTTMLLCIFVHTIVAHGFFPQNQKRINIKNRPTIAFEVYLELMSLLKNTICILFAIYDQYYRIK